MSRLDSSYAAHKLGNWEKPKESQVSPPNPRGTRGRLGGPSAQLRMAPRMPRANGRGRRQANSRCDVTAGPAPLTAAPLPRPLQGKPAAAERNADGHVVQVAGADGHLIKGECAAGLPALLLQTLKGGGAHCASAVADPFCPPLCRRQQEAWLVVCEAACGTTGAALAAGQPHHQGSERINHELQGMRACD